MTLTINDQAPDFTAQTTEGDMPLETPRFLTARVVLEACCHAPKHVQRDSRPRLDDSSKRTIADYEEADG